MVKKFETLLRSIFAVPTRSKVQYKDVKALLVHLGAEVREGSGSRVKFYFADINGGRILSLHRPHAKELCKAAVEDVRDILVELGVSR